MQQHERFDAFITVLIEESDKSRDMDSALIDLQKVKQERIMKIARMV